MAPTGHIRWMEVRLGSWNTKISMQRLQKLQLTGKIVHPGYAKGKMINSILIANEIIAALPAHEVPEHTEGYEGFFHLHDLSGTVEKTVLRIHHPRS